MFDIATAAVEGALGAGATYADARVMVMRTESMNSLYARHVHDILKIWLAIEGPDRILAWAATKDRSIEWENRYSHLCDSCRAVYSDERVTAAIHTYGHEKFDELMSAFAARSIQGPVQSTVAPSARSTAQPSTVCGHRARAAIAHGTW